jgi:hypothetical protein
MEFIGQYLSHDITENEKSLISKIRKNIIENEEFIRNREAEIAPLLERKRNEDFSSIVNCPVCFEQTLILSEELHMCAFCGYGGSYKSILDKWCTVFIGYPYTDPKERDLEPVVHLCQECFEEALVQNPDVGNALPRDPGWVCFACGSSYVWGEIELCPRCGEPYTVDPDGFPFCSDCLGRMIDKD